jgi:hypothetical protein
MEAGDLTLDEGAVPTEPSMALQVTAVLQGSRHVSSVPHADPMQRLRIGCVACKPQRDTPEPSAALVQAGVGESCRGYCKNNGYDCDEAV